MNDIHIGKAAARVMKRMGVDLKEGDVISRAEEPFHPPVPMDRVPEIACVVLTNASANRFLDYLEELPETTPHLKAYKARLKLAGKVCNTHWPVELTSRIAPELITGMFAVLIMFDETVAILREGER